MKGIAISIGSIPAAGPVRICAQNMVIGQNMLVAEPFDRLHIVTHGNWVSWIFGLGIDNADLHE